VLISGGLGFPVSAMSCDHPITAMARYAPPHYASGGHAKTTNLKFPAAQTKDADDWQGW